MVLTTKSRLRLRLLLLCFLFISVRRRKSSKSFYKAPGFDLVIRVVLDLQKMTTDSQKMAAVFIQNKS